MSFYQLATEERLLIGIKDNSIRCAVGIAVAHRALASGSMSRS